jgi:hypothetical protein
VWQCLAADANSIVAYVAQLRRDVAEELFSGPQRIDHLRLNLDDVFEAPAIQLAPTDVDPQDCRCDDQ